MSAPNHIIVNKAQRCRKDFARVDEPTVELRLYTIMVPSRRTKIRELEQGRNLGMKHGIVGPANGWIILPSITRHLSHAQITPRLCQICLPCHTSDSSDASFQRAFMNISGLYPMKVLYIQWVRTHTSIMVGKQERVR